MVLGVSLDQGLVNGMIGAQDDRADETICIEVAREIAGVGIFVGDEERATASDCVPGGDVT
jgi:hypothetical protein